MSICQYVTFITVSKWGYQDTQNTVSLSILWQAGRNAHQYHGSTVFRGNSLMSQQIHHTEMNAPTNYVHHVVMSEADLTTRVKPF